MEVDEATLRERLTTRTNNSYGRAAHELGEILVGHATFDDDYRRYGAYALDATWPVGEVVDELLSKCQASLLRAH